MRTRAAHVLGRPNAEVAQGLREAPGQWMLIGGGQDDELGVLRSTAYRIRHGQMDDFPADANGKFRAKVSNAKTRINPSAPVEVFGMFVPTAGDDPGTDRSE